MSLAVRALGAVLALLALLFPWPATAAAAGAPAGGTHHVYSYDAPSYPWENDTAPERGPPVEGYANTIYDALGFCSLGNSERSSGFRARATYNYDDVALLVESDILAGATTALAAKASGALSTPAAGDVAANTGSAIVKVGDFGSTSSALSHYSKHVKGVVLGKNGSATVRAGGPDMPEFANFSQYRAAARDFMGGGGGPGVIERGRGTDILRVDPSTGYVGVRSQDGTIRTFFRPDGDPVAYFWGLQ